LGESVGTNFQEKKKREEMHEMLADIKTKVEKLKREEVAA
jgi:hypothetical protein